MRLVISVLLLGLLAGCVSDHYGYYDEPVYAPVYEPFYGPRYDPYYHAPRPYVVVPGHVHPGYRVERHGYRAPPHHQPAPHHPPAYRPPHGHGVNPPGQHHRQPPAAPGYLGHDGPRHDAGRGQVREEHRRPSHRIVRDDAPRERWQGSPRPHWGGGHPGRGESRRYR